MGRPRVTISTLMALVLVAAANMGVVRLLLARKVQVLVSGPTNTTVELIIFALGVLPMASLLGLCALARLPRLIRRGEAASFLVGFEVVGWASVVMFISWSVLSPQSVFEYALFPFSLIEPAAKPLMAAAPEWVLGVFEVVYATVVFTLPELTLALLGGWLIRRSGVTVRIERRPRDATETASFAGPRVAV